MKTQPHLSLTKLDAGTRQLHLAIDLFFKDADPIGVHTLAGASHGIFRGLLVHAGGTKGPRARSSRAERASRRLVERNIAEAKNFLKHADRDPTKVLQFHPNWTDFLLFDAIHMHIQLAQTVTKPNISFLIWLSAKYPGVSLLPDFLGATELLSELRRIFPAVGSPSAQKRTFRKALNLGASSD
jgi:hypothetical protein